MLSIGKLAAGQAKYYLDQAQGRVDAIDSVAGGAEDYYAGSGEAQGVWLGAGSRELGLERAVTGAELRKVLAGADPRTDAALRQGNSPVRVAAYDLTFSAPKSVSVVFGIGDPELRVAVRGAHDRAVREAVAYLERSAAGVRRGHGGTRLEPADGLVAAAFRHRTSRAGDPQLHTHVLVANLGRGPDGRWTALDGRLLYAHARAASFIYQAVLRAELTRELGLEWAPVRRGIAEVVGVPRVVMRAFSRRRSEIEAALAVRGTNGARAAEAAALATRGTKDRAVTADGLVVEWRERAAALGFGREQLNSITGRAREPRMRPQDWDRMFDALAAPSGVTRSQSTFGRREVIQALCELPPAGVAIDARTLGAAADRFLGSGRAAAVLPGGASFRRRDGRLLPVAREELRYSTPELLAREQHLIERAVSSAGASVGVASAKAVRRSINRRPTLSAEQRGMVERLCLGGDGVAVVAGKAGTGKTYALGAAREAWQAAGYPVLGVAVARRAARELETGAGIASTSTVALLGDLMRGGAPLPDGCVLVVDEAAMVSTRQLADLLDHVQRADGKLVLVGDHRQLPELEAGGAFRALVHRGLAIELTENQRQVERWERRALDLLRDGHAAAALPLYDAHGRVRLADTSEQTRTGLVGDWWAAREQAGDVVMIAYRRVDVDDLNARARERLRTAGALSEREIKLPGGRFAAGDLVVITRNQLRLGVHNGDRASVLAVDPSEQRLLLECEGRRVELRAEFLEARTDHGDPTLVHGYAITCHIAQGLTVDRAFVLADEGLSRESGYTALSRGRHANYLYATRQPDDPRAEVGPTQPRTQDPIERLAAALQSSTANTLAIDTEPGKPLADAEHRHAKAVAQRNSIEGSRWSPGRRRRLATARELEQTAARELAQARRLDAERTHGSHAFVTERDVAADFERWQDRLAERRHQRDRGRTLGRELGR